MQDNSKKKIGIMTFHRAINYGAVLQCYALNKSCQKLGFETETIDFNPFGHYTYRGLLKTRPMKAIARTMTFRYMNKFVDDYLNPTPHTEDSEWIKKNPPKDDIVIVGSDTVWSQNVTGKYLHSYLLDFLPNSITKIAYAASIGGGNDVGDAADVFKQNLVAFKAISTRERNSVNILQELSGKTVEDVCDPSLLLSQEEYSEIEKIKKTRKPYLIVFSLSGDEKVETVAKYVKKTKGLKIVNIAPTYLKYADTNFFGLRPGEWLYLIHNASFIVTDSFHGTIFSIIYRKPFFSIKVQIQTGGRVKANGRVENLLIQTGLLERYVDNFVPVNYHIEIDYSKVESQIEKYINRSQVWLEDALI